MQVRIFLCVATNSLISRQGDIKKNRPHVITKSSHKYKYFSQSKSKCHESQSHAQDLTLNSNEIVFRNGAVTVRHTHTRIKCHQVELSLHLAAGVSNAILLAHAKSPERMVNVRASSYDVIYAKFWHSSTLTKRKCKTNAGHTEITNSPVQFY